MKISETEGKITEVKGTRGTWMGLQYNVTFEEGKGVDLLGPRVEVGSVVFQVHGGRPPVKVIKKTISSITMHLYTGRNNPLRPSDYSSRVFDIGWVSIQLKDKEGTVSLLERRFPPDKELPLFKNVEDAVEYALRVKQEHVDGCLEKISHWSKRIDAWGEDIVICP